MCLQRGLYLQIHPDAMHVVCKATSHTGQKTHLVSSGRGSFRYKYFKPHLAQIKPNLPVRIGKALSFFPNLSGYHADTPITIKAEPSIWPTAAFINIHEHPL